MAAGCPLRTGTQEGTACVASGCRMEKGFDETKCGGARPDRRPSPLPGWELMVVLMPKIWPLCNSAKYPLRDRVLGEVEMNSFIALPGKEGPSRLVPTKIECTNEGWGGGSDLVRSFITMVQEWGWS